MAVVETEVREGVDRETIETVQAMAGKYKYGWETEIETEYAPKGLSEDIVRLISEKNGEPQWMLDWRLAAYRRWLQMEEPRWAMLHYPEIDYQDQYYYAKPKSMAQKPKSLDEVDPKLLATYAKLGIPLKEQALLAGVEAPEGERKVAVKVIRPGVRQRFAHDLEAMYAAARLQEAILPNTRRPTPTPSRPGYSRSVDWRMTTSHGTSSRPASSRPCATGDS